MWWAIQDTILSCVVSNSNHGGLTAGKPVQGFRGFTQMSSPGLTQIMGQSVRVNNLKMLAYWSLINRNLFRAEMAFILFWSACQENHCDISCKLAGTLTWLAGSFFIKKVKCAWFISKLICWLKPVKQTHTDNLPTTSWPFRFCLFLSDHL